MVPIISVIIPVYNVEKYLEKSITSLLNQTFKDIEFIFVNDGSTDESLKICKKYKQLDSRVKILNKENGGVSSARNAGLNIAKGRYIGFVDPDDWVESTMYEELYKKIIEESSDLVFADYYICKLNKLQEINIGISNTLSGCKIKDLIMVYMIGPKFSESNDKVIMGSICRILVRKSIIDENKIEFNLNLSYMEDLVFILNILNKAGAVSFVNKCLYYYNIHENSAVTSYKRNLNDTFSLINVEINKIFKGNLNMDIIERLDRRYLEMRLEFFKNEFRRGNLNRLSRNIKNIKDFITDERLKKISSNYFIEQLPLKKRFIIKIFFLSPIRKRV